VRRWHGWWQKTQCWRCGEKIILHRVNEHAWGLCAAAVEKCSGLSRTCNGQERWKLRADPRGVERLPLFPAKRVCSFLSSRCEAKCFFFGFFRPISFPRQAPHLKCRGHDVKWTQSFSNHAALGRLSTPRYVFSNGAFCARKFYVNGAHALWSRGALTRRL